MKIEGNKLIADEGKVLRRKVGYPIQGKIITLKMVLVNGNLVEDSELYYEEIDAPKINRFNKDINE